MLTVILGVILIIFLAVALIISDNFRKTLIKVWSLVVKFFGWLKGNYNFFLWSAGIGVVGLLIYLGTTKGVKFLVDNRPTSPPSLYQTGPRARANTPNVSKIPKSPVGKPGREFVLNSSNDLDKTSELRTRIPLPPLNVGDEIIFEDDFNFPGVVNVYVNDKHWEKKKGGIKKGEKIIVKKELEEGSYIYFQSSDAIILSSVRVRIVP